MWCVWCAWLGKSILLQASSVILVYQQQQQQQQQTHCPSIHDIHDIAVHQARNNFPLVSCVVDACIIFFCPTTKMYFRYRVIICGYWLAVGYSAILLLRSRIAKSPVGEASGGSGCASAYPNWRTVLSQWLLFFFFCYSRWINIPLLSLVSILTNNQYVISVLQQHLHMLSKKQAKIRDWWKANGKLILLPRP